jgi:hypothetical protein
MRDTRQFIGERQQRITFGAAHPAASVLAEEEHQKSEYEAEADRESEWDDGHGRRPRTAAGVEFGVWCLEFGVGGSDNGGARNTSGNYDAIATGMVISGTGRRVFASRPWR